MNGLGCGCGPMGYGFDLPFLPDQLRIFGQQVDTEDYIGAGLIGAVVGAALAMGLSKSKRIKVATKTGALVGAALGLSYNWKQAKDEEHDRETVRVVESVVPGVAGFWGYGADVSASTKDIDIEPATDAQGKPIATVLQELVPVATEVAKGLQDPYRRVELLEVKLAKLKAQGASANRVAKVEAKLRAARHALALQEGTEASHQEWANLGKTGISVGIVVGSLVGLSAVYYLVSAGKSHRTRAAA